MELSEPQWMDDDGTRPARRRHPVRTLLFAIAAVVVICCGGLAAVGYGVLSWVRGSTDPMRAAAVSFLDDMKTRDYPAAFGMLCDRTRQTFDLDALIDKATARPVLDYTVTGVYTADRTGLVGGTVTATIAYADGGTEQHAVPVVEEDGQWLVCGDPY